MWQPQSFFSQYVLRTPVILSGKEAIRGLYHYPAGKIAVIHGGSFSDAELFRSTFSKREIRFIRRSWEDEPDMKGLKGTIHELENYQPDLIIAVGGGSVIDGSKLCRLFYEFPFYEVGVSRVEGEQLKTRFIAVPTTVGSGSEVSSASVYVDRVNHRKDMVVLHGLLPDVVVYDGRYVENAPEKLLCASALDAMAHILEGYKEKRVCIWICKIGNYSMDIMTLHFLFFKLVDFYYSKCVVMDNNFVLSQFPHSLYSGWSVLVYTVVGICGPIFMRKTLDIFFCKMVTVHK